ncbi:hypothetical protein GCM10009655_22000 [Rhodoglobus aureus]|uniref:Secreted protein n=1 Tax=Rhodoglobus aureus TaxID=191497 RepID=A0ABN1VST8_9MICO
MRFLPRLSAATMTGTLSLARPLFPREIPPTKVSSTSTVPDRSWRSGTNIARRSLCIQTQAVSYDFKPKTRCSPRAETPFFCEVTNQIAANQVRMEVGVRSKIVPAVTDVRREQPVHIHRLSLVRHAPMPPHFELANPFPGPPQLCALGGRNTG